MNIKITGKCVVGAISSGVEKACWLLMLLKLTHFLDSARNDTCAHLLLTLICAKFPTILTDFLKNSKLPLLKTSS
jgi:hypothetical protein